MDAIEIERNSLSISDDTGATEVERIRERSEDANASSDAKTHDTARLSDGTKGRSSRRKPKKTHRVVDSEDEGDGDEEVNLDEYLKGKMLEGLSYSACGKAAGANDDGEEEEENEEEEDMEEEEDEADKMEEPHPPHLPEGTVVVQPVAVEDCAPASFHPPDIPYGRKTRTDVIPDHVLCTACEHRIPTNSIDNFYRHPVLRVLLCRRCVAVYESKPIRTGDDGLDDACRWCAEGGDLICCDFCHNAFCKGCIERNLGRQELHSILNAGDNEKWHCYVCHPHLLAKHVESCSAIIASVEEREKVARRRQKTSIGRSPRRSQLMPNKAAAQVTSVPDTAALASAIASQVMSASAGRRGGGRPRGRGASHHGTCKGDVLYIRTPTGGVVGIPAKSMDQMANVPLAPASIESEPKPRQSTRGRSPRGSAHRPQFTNLPSLPMTSVTLSSSPPNINEYNVWSVLEKLLAATQSMGMLLGSLKDDLRRTGTNVVAIEQLKKRREVAMKLWRAFVAYKKSFLDIEMFTRGGTTGNQTPQPSIVPQQRGNSVASRTATTPKSIMERVDAREGTAGSEDTRTDKDTAQNDAVARKRSIPGEVENSHEAKKLRIDSEPAVDQSHKETLGHADEADSEKDQGEADDGTEHKMQTDGESKADLFSSLRFEPLFEIKPMVKKE